MTLGKFQKLLKRISPKLRLRNKGQLDVIGLFVGLSGKGGYITRISKGELHLNGYRHGVYDPMTGEVKQGPIKKRGRKTVINLLRQYRWITNHKQKSMLTYGINYSDSEVKGLSGKDQYGPKS